MAEMQIGSKNIGKDHPVFIVAEIGTGYAKGLDSARRCIDAAAEAGADCAKFQTVFADEIIHPDTGFVDLPGGKTRLYEVFKNLERDTVFFAALKKHTELTGMVFLSSPFGAKGAAILRAIGVDAVKIASPELNHYPLLEEVARWNVPVIASSGVSTLGDIERALAKLSGDVVLLHCVTSYPAPPEDYNIRLVASLGAIFGILTGISDHSKDPVLVPSISAAEGAAVIEKHFTLDGAGGGLDDPVALDPKAFARMVREIREVEAIPETKRRQYLDSRFGATTVSGVLGTGIKNLAPSEKENYLTTNRSILALDTIKKGEVITQSAVALLRSEKNLLPGLPPEWLETVVGRTAKQDIQGGRGITWDDIL